MRTAVEHAGAERGLLNSSRGVLSLADSGGSHYQRRHLSSCALRDVSAAATALPESIIHYVAHTQESVILDDASTQNSYFLAQPVQFRQHRSRSASLLAL